MVISTDAQNICKSSNHLFMMKTLSKFEMALLRWHSVQFSHSVMSNSATPWTAARQASLSSQWCHPAISSCRSLLLLPPIPPSIRVFSNESTLPIRWPKYWSFSLSISPSNEHPGLVSFRMDWLDLLAVQGTSKSSPALQFKSINSSALSFLHSPTLTSIHDHWKNHSLDWTDLCWQSNISAF